MQRVLGRGTVIIAAVWTVVALLFAAHNYLSGVADGRPITLQQAVWWSVAEWYTWALVTPMVVVAVRRTRDAARGPVVSLLTLAVAGVVAAALQIGLEYGGDRAVTLLTRDPTLTVRIWLSDGARGAPLDLAYLVPRKIGFGLATYCAVVIAISALDYYRLYRDRELRAARLEAALTSAQLHALQSQLQPHFLFNTLNSIASLIPDDPEAAEEMVESLSELLRAALHEAGHFEIPLQRELELLDQYVRIQRSRFQDRLHVHFAVERGLETVLVPPLILQPIVENAIRHAVALRESGGEIAIRVAEYDGAVRLTVEDDGPGFATQSADDERSGIGLANTRARLSQLYGSDARLETTDAAAGGGVVDVWLPVRRLTPDHEPGGPRQSGTETTRPRPGASKVRTA